MDQALARGTVEELRGLELHLGGCVRGLRLLERGPQRRTLRTIAHGCRARLAHVLLCGCDIWHNGLQKLIKRDKIVNSSRSSRTLKARAEPRFREHESQGVITL